MKKTLLIAALSLALLPGCSMFLSAAARIEVARQLADFRKDTESDVLEKANADRAVALGNLANLFEANFKLLKELVASTSARIDRAQADAVTLVEKDMPRFLNDQGLSKADIAHLREAHESADDFPWMNTGFITALGGVVLNQMRVNRKRRKEGEESTEG